MERIYSALEIGKILGVGRRAVYRWIHDGDLKAFRVGGLRRVWESDLLKFIHRREGIPAKLKAKDSVL